MEAVYELDVVDMPVAVDSTGGSAHQTGPAEWRVKLAELGLGI